MDHGGKREGAGRKPIGITKKVSITLTTEQWNYINDYIEPDDVSLSQYFRELVEKDIEEIKEENRLFDEAEKEELEQ